MKEPQKQKPKLTDAERYQRFLETAERVGASDDAANLDNAILKIAGSSEATQAVGDPKQSARGSLKHDTK